ncbi:MAG: GTPase domain-containing protein [Calditrichia bacterium]|nr:GTPase domain-containing protein [Calditrichia bacterium]
MMYINWALQEINLKIVYYGPGMSGKTTNLEYVHTKLDPKLTSELVTLKTKEDRTIFFDFMQIEVGKIKGKKPKFNLYTVPGQVYYASSRKIILNGVDGIVFVADSQRDRMEGNIETLLDLEHNLMQMGFTLENFPWVIQYNKRDLPNAEDISLLQKKLNFFNVPYFEGVAIKGDGVFNTVKAIINRTVQHVQNQF